MNIRIDRDGSRFTLSGDVDALLSNSRARLALNRLNFVWDELPVHVPFEEKAAVATLQALQNILQKFGFTSVLSETLGDAARSYQREQENFKEFSEKARDIRDDRFKDKPELIGDFDEFQQVIRRDIIRTLYPLQLLSAFHMAFSQNACNFAVPGAGKTTIVYAAYAYLRQLPNDHPKHVDKLLVVGPLSSFRPWELEYEKCFNRVPIVKRLSGDITVSTKEKLGHLYSLDPAELTLIFHGGIARYEQEIVSFLRRNKTMVVVDEAHRIKNPDGIWGMSAVTIGKEASARIVLTGTPVPNGYEDLYNLFQFLYPFRYKDILGFHYGNLAEMSKAEETDSHRVSSLIRNISPFFIRIKKRDLHLPPIAEKTVIVEMDALQREIYDFVESRYIQDFRQDSTGTIKDRFNRAKLIRLRQAASNPALLQRPIQETLESEDFELESLGDSVMPEAYQEDSEIVKKILAYSNSEIPRKFVVVRDLVASKARDGLKVIVWTIFVQNAKQLAQYLTESGFESSLLIGEIEQAERELTISRFNDPRESLPKVLVANPFSVAESISLHNGCHCAIYLERDYNCANFLQSKDRIHRVGLAEGQVTEYYYLLSEGSVDEVIHDRLKNKIERMERIVDDEIPLFSRVDDTDETDLITALLERYARNAHSI